VSKIITVRLILFYSLADASLMAVAESRGIRDIFSIDSDFYIYRLADGSVLNVIR